MTLEEHMKRHQEETDNMTLAQARDIIASRLSHFDMRIRFEKAVKMLLDCADKALEQESALDRARAEIEYAMKYQYLIGEDQYAEGFEKSLEIIDKHKMESE